MPKETWEQRKKNYFSDRYKRLTNDPAYVEQRREKSYEARYRPHNMFSHYRNGAKRRGIPFELTEDEALATIGQPCAYCGDYLIHVGIDRIDSTIGYVISNIVPCCGPCNMMKITLPAELFIEQCKKIANHNQHHD